MGSYRAAWRMLRLIRQAMGKEEFREAFETIVEIDETYVGGKPRKKNRRDEEIDDEHKPKRGRGTSKAPIIGGNRQSARSGR